VAGDKKEFAGGLKSVAGSFGVFAIGNQDKFSFIYFVAFIAKCFIFITE